MPDLSVLIPARNEEFLARTIQSAVDNARGDTEVVAVMDGYWPDPPILDHPRVLLIHATTPLGQRGGTNAAARLARGKYLMKLDGHCALDEGYDLKLTAPYESGELDGQTTTVPRMYNLHAFDWACPDGHRRYQGPSGPCQERLPDKTTCGKPTAKEMVWQPRTNRRSDFARFDKTMHFQYWRSYERRPEAQGEIADLMCHVGACWMMPAARYWELGGMDEEHGSWGQMGVEVSCKSWLSGGRQVVNKRTWYSHMFRTQGGDFSFPYKISHREQEAAREYSRALWLNDRWPGATRPLRWLLDRFAPVPEWHDEEQKEVVNA